MGNIKRLFFTFFTLATLCVCAEEYTFAQNEVQLQGIYHYNHKTVKALCDTTCDFKAKIHQVGVGIEPSFTLFDFLVLDFQGIFLKNVSEKNYSEAEPHWTSHDYNGYRWEASGQALFMFKPTPRLRILPGLGFYYAFRKEGFIKMNDWKWQASIYGPYPVISLWYKLSTNWELRTYQRYIFARKVHHDIIVKKINRTQYHDQIYEGLYDLFYRVYKNWNIGLAYQLRLTRSKDNDIPEKTMNTDHEGRFIIKYDF